MAKPFIPKSFASEFCESALPRAFPADSGCIHMMLQDTMKHTLVSLSVRLKKLKVVLKPRPIQTA
jgi:hypothetical protein